jgi:nickel-dependent lactate racemase
VLLVSSLGDAAAAQVKARRAPTLEAALEEARRLTGPDARVLVLPDATDLVPVVSAAD